jgi:hypothetical protein
LFMMSFNCPSTLTCNRMHKHHGTFFRMGQICSIVDISFFPSHLSLQA